MKPIFLLCVTAIVLCSISVNSISQRNIGIIGGPTLGKMQGSFIEDSDGIEAGFHIGLRFDRSIGKNWELVTGAHWVQKGGKKLVLPGSNGVTHSFVTQYFQIPVLLRYPLQISESNWHFAPFAGLAAGINVGCKSKEGEVFEFEDPCDENSLSGSPSSNEITVPFGFNLIHKFTGGSRFYFETRFDLGLSNVFEAANEVDKLARNNTLIFGILGFSFPLNKTVE